MQKHKLLIILFLMFLTSLISGYSFSQEASGLSQTIRGQVIDLETHATLPGATIIVLWLNHQRIKQEPLIQWHIEQAYKDGATILEVMEALEVAIDMGIGPVTVNARFALDVMENTFGKIK